MYDSVPFDPPYILKINSQDGDRWVEVCKDGTEVPCEAPLHWSLHSSEAAATSPSTSTTSKKPQFTVLNVPYAEKDEAKRLGAKWDPTRKKWYVPQGVSAEPFSRWISGN
ncbi:DUF5710 domain-containing protein [Duganella sp. CF458]|uniref:DUF5710 domain-containing protein n=1 Tax=Duganella sp. CF458 TaxID=1884368 RepID=UPI001E3FCDDB|nr:DUF5710 domain-containing protein [Duganella sp. CF458]